MIDIHTHILPSIDDGAKDVDVALQMLQEEIKQGVKDVVFTPHYYAKKNSPAQFLEKRRQAFSLIQSEIPENIRVHLGAEVRFSDVNPLQHDELCSLAIESTRYILLELPFREEWTDALLESLQSFIEETEYVPIIAHIERYPAVWKNPALVFDLARMGCLIQANTSAFLQKRERNLLTALLRKGLVHCLGTDTHDLSNRAPDYEKTKELFIKKGMEKDWERLQENMSWVLQDVDLPMGSIAKVKKILRWYF